MGISCLFAVVNVNSNNCKCPRTIQSFKSHIKKGINQQFDTTFGEVHQQDKEQK